MSKKQLVDSLLEWLRTSFTLSNTGAHQSAEDLCDGVCLAYVLHQISQDHFTTEWLNKIVKSNVDNWRIRISNIKKILEAIENFHDSIGSPISPTFTRPDPQSIGKDLDRREMGRLLQLILGCAVNCDRKEDYVQIMMDLEAEVQLAVKQAIEELLSSREPSSINPADASLNLDQLVVLRDSLQRTSADLQLANEAKDRAIQEVYDLRRELDAITADRDQIQQENHTLTNKLRAAENARTAVDHEPSDASLKDRHVNKLQLRIDTLQDNLFTIESQKDEYRVKNELLESELMELKLRNEELQRKANEARRLKDDIDVLREASEKNEKLEQTVEVYRKKLEEMADLKRQMKLIEDKSGAHLKRAVEAEDELRRSGTIKSQIDIYKKQIQELKTQLVEQTHRSQQFEFEAKRLAEKYAALDSEKENLMKERTELRSKVTESKKRSSSSYAEELYKNGFNASVSGNESGLNLSSEISGKDEDSPITLVSNLRDQVVRLETENRLLQARLEESEVMVVSQAAHQAAQQRIVELESELKVSNSRLLELRAQLSVDRLDRESSDDIHSLKSELHDYELKVAHLESALAKKDEEMTEMEAKHKKYVAKAKQVAKVIEPLSLQMSANSSLVSDVGTDGQSMRLLVNQKDKQISELEIEAEKAKAFQEMEQRLMTVAFHSLASQLQRRAAEERITGRAPSSAQSSTGSFLSRQRQASSRRLNNMTGVAQNDFFE